MVKAEDDDLNYSAKLRCTDDGTREYIEDELISLMLIAEGE